MEENRKKILILTVTILTIFFTWTFLNFARLYDKISVLRLKEAVQSDDYSSREKILLQNVYIQNHLKSSECNDEILYCNSLRRLISFYRNNQLYAKAYETYLKYLPDLTYCSHSLFWGREGTLFSIYYDIGVIKMELGDFKGAEGLLLKSLEYNKMAQENFLAYIKSKSQEVILSPIDVYISLADLKIRQNRYGEAAQFLEKAQIENSKIGGVKELEIRQAWLLLKNK